LGGREGKRKSFRERVTAVDYLWPVL